MEHRASGLVEWGLGRLSGEVVERGGIEVGWVNVEIVVGRPDWEIGMVASCACGKVVLELVVE